MDEEVNKKDFKSVSKPGLSDPSLIIPGFSDTERLLKYC